MKDSKFYLRNQKYSYYYSNDKIIVYMDSDSVELNPLYSEVVEKCDGENSLLAITEGIFGKYEINEDDTEARQLFNTVIEELLSYEIIEEVSEKAPKSYHVNQIAGKKGKSFPRSLILEVTNKCNFCCKHCFKEAKPNNTEYIHPVDFECFLSKLSSHFEVIEITGGECTLHPQINSIIEMAVKVANKVSLLSNGSNIHAVAPDKLSSLHDVQITLYGYDNESYKEFTSNEKGFDAVNAGLETIKNQNCNLNIAICVTKSNYKKLGKFIEFACQFNPNEIRFSLVLPLGRASKNEHHKNWEFSREELSEVRNIINDWADKLSPHINVRRFGELLLEEADNTDTLRCTAGKTRIVISENGVVRPCIYMPEDIFSMGTMSQYVDELSDGKKFDFTDGVSEFKKRLLKDGFTIADMQCTGFCRTVSLD